MHCAWQPNFKNTCKLHCRRNSVLGGIPALFLAMRVLMAWMAWQTCHHRGLRCKAADIAKGLTLGLSNWWHQPRAAGSSPSTGNNSGWLWHAL